MNKMTVMALCAAMCVLTACGRAGAPISPSQAAAAKAEKSNSEDAKRGEAKSESEPEGRSFILDGLLD